MQTHNPNEPDKYEAGHEPEEIDASHGYEATDVRVSGVVVFLVALSIFAVVTAVLAYGVGKVINAHLARENGPPGKWAKTVDIRQLGNMPSNPEMQNKVAELTQQFPTPRLQTDDGSEDIANLHAREELLLENYSWANQEQGKVRIPIERAMELIAQSGLPVAPQVNHEPLLTGDSKPVVAYPLTNGFARTGYELDEATTEAVAGKRK